MKKPKRLLIVVGSYYPAIGGGEHANQQLASLARDNGWDVTVVVPTSTSSTYKSDPFGVPVHYVKAQKLAHHMLIPRPDLARIVLEFDPHVIQFNGPNLHDYYGVRLARSRRIPSVGVYYADYRDDRFVSRIATSVYARAVLPLFDRVCVISESYRKLLERRGVAAGRVTNVGVGADLSTFKPAASYDGRVPTTLLFVGRLDHNHSYKRLDLLLEAMSRLRTRRSGLTLRVIGEGDTKRQFELQARELALGDSVTFLGAVDAQRLSIEYRNADLLVLPSPSKSEGFGMVIVEAYASGCPAVTSDLAGGREVIDKSGIGALWNAKDVTDLERAIDDVLTVSIERADVARRTRLFTEQFYSWESVGKRLLAVLHGALGEGRVVKNSRLLHS